MSTRLRGFDELARELDQMANSRATGVGQTAINTAARYYRKQLKAKVPRGKEDSAKTRRVKGGGVVTYDYGRWANNIRVSALKRRGKDYLRVQVSMGDDITAAWKQLGVIEAEPEVAEGQEEASHDPEGD